MVYCLMESHYKPFYNIYFMTMLEYNVICLQKRGSGILVECYYPENEGAVYLNSEEIKELKEEYFTSFTRCKQLLYLDLGIEKIDSGAFVHLEQLEILDLRNNYLRCSQGSNH